MKFTTRVCVNTFVTSVIILYTPIAVLTYKTLPAQSRTCWERFDPAASKQLFRGRAPIGQIEINNDTDQTVNVVLYHPDSDGSEFATWTVKPGSQTFLVMDGKRINIGGDWGIKISSSCILPVGEGGIYREGHYQVKSSSIFF
jgi:hypothetical protein